MTENLPEKNIEFIFIEPDSPRWLQIIDLAKKYDHEFCPPISRRMSFENYFARFRSSDGFTLVALNETRLIGFLCNFYKHLLSDLMEKEYTQHIIINPLKVLTYDM